MLSGKNTVRPRCECARREAHAWGQRLRVAFPTRLPQIFMTPPKAVQYLKKRCSLLLAAAILPHWRSSSREKLSLILGQVGELTSCCRPGVSPPTEKPTAWT